MDKRDMTNKEDNELVRRALEGNKDAFDTLIERYYDMIYRLAYRYCGIQEHAEDIAHDVFLKLAKNLSKFRQDSSFKTWLYRIVVNTAHDFTRKQGRINVKTAPLNDNERTPDSNAEERLYATEILEIINGFPTKERDAFLLIVAEGLSHAEAADILGCKEGTVSWHVHNARKKIITILEKGAKHDG